MSLYGVKRLKHMGGGGGGGAKYSQTSHASVKRIRSRWITTLPFWLLSRPPFNVQ